VHLQGTQEEWSHVFLLFGGLYAFAMIIFVISGSAELLSWGKAKETSRDVDEEKQLEKLVA
jgi:ACS family sodium-dependent inorganic phosphate cotransporter/ACS family sodium-dependent inorganic phosphate cotransporter-like MFS transporter 1/2/3/4